MTGLVALLCLVKSAIVHTSWADNLPRTLRDIKKSASTEAPRRVWYSSSDDSSQVCSPPSNVNRRSKLYREAARDDLRLGGYCARVRSNDVHGEDEDSVCVTCCMVSFILESIRGHANTCVVSRAVATLLRRSSASPPETSAVRQQRAIVLSMSCTWAPEAALENFNDGTQQTNRICIFLCLLLSCQQSGSTEMTNEKNETVNNFIHQLEFDEK